MSLSFIHFGGGRVAAVQVLCNVIMLCGTGSQNIGIFALHSVCIIRNITWLITMKKHY